MVGRLPDSFRRLRPGEIFWNCTYFYPNNFLVSGTFFCAGKVFNKNWDKRKWKGLFCFGRPSKLLFLGISLREIVLLQLCFWFSLAYLNILTPLATFVLVFILLVLLSLRIRCFVLGRFLWFLCLFRCFLLLRLRGIFLW